MRNAWTPLLTIARSPGATGENAVQRSKGAFELLDGNDQVELEPGDTFVMKTPGGGGFGKANL